MAETKSAGNGIGTFVQLADVFPELTTDFETFRSILRQLSRTDTLFWCARLNLIISNPAISDFKEKQEFGLARFFGSEEIAGINNLFRQRGSVEKVTVFFRGQLLELIRWACLLCEDQANDGNTYESPEVRRLFAQAVLIASELWGNRVYPNLSSFKGDLQQARYRCLPDMRLGVEGSSYQLDALRALGRGSAMFREHLPKFHGATEKDFQAKTGLTLKDYFDCLATLITNFLNQNEDVAVKDIKNPGIFNINNTFSQATTDLQIALAKYFTLETQTADELREAVWPTGSVAAPDSAGRYDLNPLRRRPILRAKTGDAIIMDPVFYAERATAGPLFILMAGLDKAQSNQVFACFGRAFELYAWNILKLMYPHRTGGLVNRLTCDLRGCDRQGQEVQVADACLNDATEIVLFEMKAAWVREDLIASSDYEDFLKHLRERYEADKFGRGIAHLVNGEWQPAGQDLTAAKRLFPVLVVYDALMAAPNYAQFLGLEFTKALAPEQLLPNGEMRKGRFRIAPLVVMTIEDLENLETSVEHFCLRDLLGDYCAGRDNQSLHHFMFTSKKYKPNLRHSRSVASSALPIVEETAKRLFPNRFGEKGAQ